MDAAASGGHFNVYTASVVYGGVGATEFGVTRSKLWNPFDSDMNGGEEKSKEFAEWLSGDVEIVKAYRQAIAGRLVICDCGFDWCPCAMLNFAMGHGMVSAKPEGLLERSEWRLRVRRALEKSCDTQYLGECVTRFIATKAGGISECARLLFVPVPDSQTKVTSDLLPLQLYDWSTHRGKSKHQRRKGCTANQANWIWLMSLGCNYLYAGGSRLLADCLTPDADKLDGEHVIVQQTFLRSINRVLTAAPAIKAGDLEAKLKGLVAGYSGQPLNLPQKLTAEQAESGLPPEGFGGKVNPLDFAVGETRRWLENPEEALLPEDEWPSEPERAKVYCDDDEWPGLVHLAFKRGVLDSFGQVTKEEIFSPRGMPCTVGCFGVVRPKDPISEKGPGLRLIFNARAPNAYLRNHLGDVRTLPNAALAMRLVLLEDEVAYFFSEDQRASVYLYKLPSAWRKFFVIGKLAPGWCVGMPQVPEVQVCVNVVPMGWLLAVSAVQHIERQLTLADEPGGAGIQIPELTGPARAFQTLDAFPPEHLNCLKTYHQTLLDDWDQVKVGNVEEVLSDLHRPSLQQLRLCQAFDRHSVARPSSKPVEGDLLMPSLYVDWNDKTGTVGPSGARLCQLVGALLWAAAVEEPSLLLLQEVMGLACFCGAYQRAIYACFSSIFHWMNAPKPGPLPEEVVDELLTAASVCFSCVCHLKNEVDGVPVATYASPAGGGSYLGVELSAQGVDTWEDHWSKGLTAEKEPTVPEGSSSEATIDWNDRNKFDREHDRQIDLQIEALKRHKRVTSYADQVDQTPGRTLFDGWNRLGCDQRILIVSLFDGIGGISQAFKLANLRVAGLIVVEPDAGCREVVRRHFAVSEEYTDVSLITATVVDEWRHTFGDCQIFWSAGSLGSIASGECPIFWDAPRIDLLLSRSFGRERVAGLFEQLATLEAHDIQTISEAFQVQPIYINSDGCSQIRRPRFYWLVNYALQMSSAFDDLLQQRKECDELIIRGDGPKLESFIQPGGVAQLPLGSFYPTLTRPLPKRVEPKYTAGLFNTSAGAIERWKANDFRHQPYQYEEDYLVLEDDVLRPLCAIEKERLMGFSSNYTSGMDKAAAKPGCWTTEDRRADALGNSFHCIVVAHLVSHAFALKTEEVQNATQIWERFWKLEKEVAEWHAVLDNLEGDNFEHASELNAAAAEQFSLVTYEMQVAAKAEKSELAQHVAYNHLRMCDQKGSDVRLNPSQAFRPHVLPLTFLDLKQWIWKVVQSYAFKQTQHVNVLKMRAILNYLRLRCRDTRKHRARMLLFVDSRVVCSELAKGRSSSQQVNAVLRRMSGLIIASDTQIAVGWGQSDPDSGVKPFQSDEEMEAEEKESQEMCKPVDVSGDAVVAAAASELSFGSGEESENQDGGT